MKAFEKNLRASLEMSECPEGAQVLGGETDLRPSKRIRLFSSCWRQNLVVARAKDRNKLPSVEY